jgi:hypothetical protein
MKNGVKPVPRTGPEWDQGGTRGVSAARLAFSSFGCCACFEASSVLAQRSGSPALKQPSGGHFLDEEVLLHLIQILRPHVTQGGSQLGYFIKLTAIAASAGRKGISTVMWSAAMEMSR